MESVVYKTEVNFVEKLQQLGQLQMSYKLRLPAAVKIGYVLGMEGLFLIFVVNRDKATDTVNGIHFFFCIIVTI